MMVCIEASVGARVRSKSKEQEASELDILNSRLEVITQQLTRKSVMRKAILLR